MQPAWHMYYLHVEDWADAEPHMAAAAADKQVVAAMDMLSCQTRTTLPFLTACLTAAGGQVAAV